jgi:hypothetical protein
MDNKLLYALAPDGATDHLHGMYRKFQNGDWYFWSEYGQWVPSTSVLIDEYKPIPERELELNWLADNAELPEGDFDIVRRPKSDKGYLIFFGPRSVDDGPISGHEVFEAFDIIARRALRIEHGLIATLTDEGAKDVNDTEVQWMPEVGEWCNVIVVEGVFECLIVGRDEALFIFRSSGGYPHGAYDGATLGCFRPIKTERERFIELTCCETDSDFENIFGKIHDWLIESGIDISPLMEGKDNE